MKYVTCSVVLMTMTLTLAAQSSKKPVIKPQPAVVTTIPIPDSATRSAASIAGYLTAHTTDQKVLLQSLYGWMANHISYDVVNTYQPDYYKDTADAVNKTLRTRSAVCQGYASLFMAVCRSAGIPAWLVSGYTVVNGRQQGASHAWVAVFVDGQWKLADPTWGAGYLTNNKFVQHTDWKHFLQSPAVFIKTHVPFDPLFQMSDHPFRHDEIRDNRLTEAASRPVFAYRDTLAAFAARDEYARIQNMAIRIQQYGVTNQLITTELTNLINYMRVEETNRVNASTVAKHNQWVDKINRSSHLYNEVVNSFNEYVQYKNRQFSPSRPDGEIRDWIDGIAVKLADTEKLLNEVAVQDESLKRNANEIRAAARSLEKRVADEQAFVMRYIKTGRLFRKTLFYKTAF